jgi:hypothetical protein
VSWVLAFGGWIGLLFLPSVTYTVAGREEHPVVAAAAPSKDI